MGGIWVIKGVFGDRTPAFFCCRVYGQHPISCSPTRGLQQKKISKSSDLYSRISDWSCNRISINILQLIGASLNFTTIFSKRLPCF